MGMSTIRESNSKDGEHALVVLQHADTTADSFVWAFGKVVFGLLDDEKEFHLHQQYTSEVITRRKILSRDWVLRKPN